MYNRMHPCMAPTEVSVTFDWGASFVVAGSSLLGLESRGSEAYCVVP